MQSKFVVISVFILVFVVTSTVNAIDIVPAKPDTTIVENEEESTVVKYIPYVQFGLGISTRTDQVNLIDNTQMLHAKIYYSISEKASGKFGIGYSNANQFKSALWQSISYSDFRLEIGFRWNLIKKIVTLYHENGLEYNYYTETQSDIWEHRIGMNFSIGISFQVLRSIDLDFSIGQTINNVSFGTTKNINPSTSPIGLKDNRFFNEVFNPLAVQILFFKKL